jgi:hypothetical protein
VSAPVTLTVERSAPTIAIAVSPSAPRYNELAGVTVTINGPAGPATGNVHLTNATVANGSLTSGSMHTDARFGVGAQTVTVTYDGDSNYAPSSQNLTFTVQKAIPTLTLSGPAMIASGSPLTLTATMAPSGPTGNITFSASGIAAQSAPLDASAVAATTLLGLAPGTYQLTADFAGNEHFEAVASDPLTVIVTLPVSGPPAPTGNTGNTGTMGGGGSTNAASGNASATSAATSPPATGNDTTGSIGATGSSGASGSIGAAGSVIATTMPPALQTKEVATSANKGRGCQSQQSSPFALFFIVLALFLRSIRRSEDRI